MPVKFPAKSLKILCALVVATGLTGCGAASESGSLFSPDFWAQTPFKSKNSDAELGIAEMAKGNYLGAEALFLQALKQNSRDVYALLGAGILYQNTGQMVKAREMYQAILAIRPPEAEQFIPFQNVTTVPISQLASLNLSLIDSGGVMGQINHGTTVNGGVGMAGSNSTGMGAGGDQPVTGALTLQPTMSNGEAGVQQQSSRQASSDMSTDAPSSMNAIAPDLGMSRAEKNVLSRFTTMRALRDQGLISPDEFRTRRQANIGALLPLTSPPPAAGLDRPVPSTEQISNRLRAIGRALELRAITVSQHATERNMILDALMPAAPKVVASPALPPKGLLEAADNVRKLEQLRDNGYITSDEYARERSAIEASMEPKNGVPVSQSKMAAPESSQTSSMAEQPKAMSGSQPGVHLASYRSTEQAERGWSQLRRAHGKILGDLSHTVVKVDLGTKGVFYRLVAGPFASSEKAAGVCTELKSRRQYCEPVSAIFG